jgi:hypothetical protein
VALILKGSRFMGYVRMLSWSVFLGGFLSMDLTHAHIPMGDGTFEVLYS